MIGRSWVTRKVVCVHVVAVFQIVHELWVVSHESFTCFTTSAFTLYTYYIELSTGGHTFFLFFALQMSIPPQLSPPQYISKYNSTILKPSKWRHCDPEHCKKKMKLWKERSLRVQTSCKDFDQIGIQQPDACTWAELKFKLWRGLTRNSRVEFHSNLRGRYPPWTSKGSPTFVKNLRNVI